MEGLAIEFIKAGAVLAVTKKVADFSTIAQNGMVNIGTEKGSDPLYKKRGTQLYNSGVVGALTTYSDAYHAANFAALDTVFFLKSSDYAVSEYERVEAVALEPITYTKSQMNINARFEGEAGTVIGKRITN
jgi:hypothetical protein